MNQGPCSCSKRHGSPGSGLRGASSAQRAPAELQQNPVCSRGAEPLWESGETGAGYEPGPEAATRPGMQTSFRCDSAQRPWASYDLRSVLFWTLAEEPEEAAAPRSVYEWLHLCAGLFAWAADVGMAGYGRKPPAAPSWGHTQVWRCHVTSHMLPISQ